ncbi:unnamed protein product [Rotaria sp. Silwood2]|nr:unnamed protein product [Rotaria sp. Silwood2]
MKNNKFYHVDDRYNSNSTPTIKTNGQSPVKSYREQIQGMLARWHQLQKEKQQQQQQQKQYQGLNFDEIMENDLARQLHELEQQEQKQYNLLKQTLELELTQDDDHSSMDDVDERRIKLQEIEILKQYERNEQQHQYDTMLQKLKQYEQLETLENNQEYKPKSNDSASHHTKKYIYIHQQKHILKLQLTMMRENQMKTTKIIHLLESYTNREQIYVIEKRKQTKTK